MSLTHNKEKYASLNKGEPGSRYDCSSARAASSSRMVYDCTASELHNPDKFLEMAEIFSLDISDSDELLRQHREIASTDYNKTPEVREQAFDLDAAE